MFAHVLNWLDKPFSEDMSATQWFAFIGMVLAMLMLWKMVLKHMD